jgi:hypothetical protein
VGSGRPQVQAAASELCLGGGREEGPALAGGGAVGDGAGWRCCGKWAERMATCGRFFFEIESMYGQTV